MSPDTSLPRASRPGHAIRAVVFDFDGTLAHLTIDFDAMRELVADTAAPWLGHRPSPDGLPVLEWIESLRDVLHQGGDTGAADGLYHSCHDAIRDMECRAADQGDLFPFTRDLLASLDRAGVPVAVITRNCADALDHLFPDLRDHVRILLTRDHVDAVKPDPRHLLAAARALGTPPEAILMVGDHPLDMDTGLRAGAVAGGVASGRIGERELAEAGAHHTAPDALRLVRGLAGLGLLPAVLEKE